LPDLVAPACVVTIRISTSVRTSFATFNLVMTCT
jgi:hypothetical protein